MTLIEVLRQIKRILTNPEFGYLQSHPRASAGLQWIVDGTEKKYEHEASCDEYTDWLHVHGVRHALRPPNEWERARAAGLAKYLAALGLEGRRLYDVVGLAFDPRALQRRLYPLVHDWDAGLSPRAPPCPSLGEVVTLYRNLDHTLQQHAPFAPRELDPFPTDLMPVPARTSATMGDAACLTGRPAAPLAPRLPPRALDGPPASRDVLPVPQGTPLASAAASSSGESARP